MHGNTFYNNVTFCIAANDFGMCEFMVKFYMF